jgi:hypothetical protein
MGSSGKRKTTMAKVARENRLRERRLDKQARKDARRQASTDQRRAQDTAPESLDARPEASSAADLVGAGPELRASADDADRACLDVSHEPTDPRSKEVALGSLREASDEEPAVFEGKLEGAPARRRPDRNGRSVT